MSEVEKLSQELAMFTGLSPTQGKVRLTRDQTAFTFALCEAFWLIQIGSELSPEKAELVYDGFVNIINQIAEKEDVFGEEFSDDITVLYTQIVADHGSMSGNDFNTKYRRMAQNLGLNYMIRG